MTTLSDDHSVATFALSDDLGSPTASPLRCDFDDDDDETSTKPEGQNLSLLRDVGRPWLHSMNVVGVLVQEVQQQQQQPLQQQGGTTTDNNTPTNAATTTTTTNSGDSSISLSPLVAIEEDDAAVDLPLTSADYEMILEDRSVTDHNHDCYGMPPLFSSLLAATKKQEDDNDDTNEGAAFDFWTIEGTKFMNEKGESDFALLDLCEGGGGLTTTEEEDGVSTAAASSKKYAQKRSSTEKKKATLPKKKKQTTSSKRRKSIKGPQRPKRQGKPSGQRSAKLIADFSKPVDEVKETDAIAGRGTGVYDRLGNRMFREFCTPYKSRYQAHDGKKGGNSIKADIAREVMGKYHKDAGGRFVVEVCSTEPQKTGWFQIQEKELLVKIKYLLALKE